MHPDAAARTVIDLFAVSWPEVGLDHVRAFLDDAGSEGVTWEAKADDERGILRPDSIRKAACGLANQIGGYVIIGAKWDKAAGRWTLPGIAAPDDQPELWLGKLLRLLNPTPRFDARAWTLDEGRIVAVVWVEQVEAPPCMTPRGHVYERVSGETLPVRDPAVLAALFERGRTARKRAIDFSVRAGTRALGASDWPARRSVGITVALASVGRDSDDINARLFTASFRAEVVAATERLVALPHTTNPTTSTRTEQDAFSCFVEFREDHVLLSAGSALPQHHTTWHILASWDGAVAASMSFDADASRDPPGFDLLLRTAWRELASIVDGLGGYGPAHLAIGIEASATGSGLYPRLPSPTWIGRTVNVGEPDEEVVASVEREVKRAGGVIADEPARN